MAKKCILIICLLTAFTIINCYAGDESYTVKPKFEIGKILQESREFAAKNKENLDKYFIDDIRYEASDKKWMVHFQGYILMPGNDFVIFFDEATEKMQLMLGE